MFTCIRDASGFGTADEIEENGKFSKRGNYGRKFKCYGRKLLVTAVNKEITAVSPKSERKVGSSAGRVQVGAAA